MRLGVRRGFVGSALLATPVPPVTVSLADRLRDCRWLTSRLLHAQVTLAVTSVTSDGHTGTQILRFSIKTDASRGERGERETMGNHPGRETNQSPEPPRVFKNSFIFK